MPDQHSPSRSEDFRAWKQQYNRAYAEANRERIREMRKAYYEATRAERLRKTAEYRANNRAKIQAAKKAYTAANTEHVRRQRADSTLRRRLRALTHYAGTPPSCACCGESTPGFLTLDHIGGGGNSHRAEIGQGRLYSWLEARGYPEGYRVLCFNCNWADGVYGRCPHVDPMAGNFLDVSEPWGGRTRPSP